MLLKELQIGLLLRVGLWLSVLIVLLGGILYLLQCGSIFIQYEVFPSTLLLICPGLRIIQFGLLILVITQVLRVILTAWLFMQKRDYFFTFISLIIFGFLIYSIFWGYNE